MKKTLLIFTFLWLISATPQVTNATPIFTETFTISMGTGDQTQADAFRLSYFNNDFATRIFTNTLLTTASIGQTYTANSVTDLNFGLFASYMKNGVDEAIMKWFLDSNAIGGAGVGKIESFYSFGTPDLFGTSTELTSVSLYVQDLRFYINPSYPNLLYRTLTGTLTFDGTSVSAVPEPSSLLLLGSGLLGLVAWRRQRVA